MIVAENLTKIYGLKPAVQDISFHVNKGEIVGFLGPNGAGKTTILRTLTCFMPPTSGKVLIGGL
ncbi:MAG: ATP-binding cassette domain-containing protein, partial [Desulfobacterales bacterium]|nr:ATP-binding cassette domain-containing protein [Desulfobacterales bacterium]